MEISSNAERSDEHSTDSTCPTCSGAGFIHPTLSSGQPDYGRIIACRCTREESAKDLQSRLRRESGLGLGLLRNMSFDNFKLDRVNLPEEQLNVALEFAKSPDGWLVFQGDTGCGKTHLAVAIANYRLKMGKPAKFVVVPDFLDHLRSTFSPESKVSYDQLFEEVKSTPLLVLDDLGEQTSTPWAQEKLFQVINHRYNARSATVITTRCTTEEIDDPISSRMIDQYFSNFFNITAPDYRGDLQNNQRSRTPRHPRK